jgi:transposase
MVLAEGGPGALGWPSRLPRRKPTRSLEDHYLRRRSDRADVGAYFAVSAHKVAGIRDAIEAQDAKLLYLPPYSPDFNPIENALAKLKPHVRKAAARTFDALETAAAKALARFKADKCLNFFAHAGYGLDLMVLL